jgi:hypothetical protein
MADRHRFVAPVPGASDIGELFSRTVALLRAYPRVFMALAFVTALPIGLAAIAIDLAYTVPENDLGQLLLASAIGLVPSLLLLPISGAATTVAVVDCLNGRPPQASHALEVVGERFWPLASTIVVSAVGFALGGMAFLIPGIILLVFWLFAPQATVVEGLGVRESLRRSRALVAGAFWPVLGIYFLFQIVTALVTVVVTLVFALPSLAFVGDGEKIALGIAEIAATTVAAPVALIGVSLMYLDRRVRREGPWPEPVKAAQAT